MAKCAREENAGYLFQQLEVQLAVKVKLDDLRLHPGALRFVLHMCAVHVLHDVCHLLQPPDDSLLHLWKNNKGGATKTMSEVGESITWFPLKSSDPLVQRRRQPTARTLDGARPTMPQSCCMVMA
jgi:hypothetical protein